MILVKEISLPSGIVRAQQTLYLTGLDDIMHRSARTISEKTVVLFPCVLNNNGSGWRNILLANTMIGPLNRAQMPLKRVITT